MRRATSTTELAVLILLCAVLAAYVAYPIGAGVLSTVILDGGITFEHYRELFEGGRIALIEAIVNSSLVSIFSVIFSAIVGSFVAFMLSQLNGKAKALISSTAVLPVAMPPLVGVIALLFVFGEGGIIPRGLSLLFGLDESVAYLEGIPAIVAVHTYAFHVYFILFLSSALNQIDFSQFEAAVGLGASAWRAFSRVILPQLRPALLGASVLTFMASMTSFSAPLIFGGEKHFLTTLIYTTKLNGDIGLAATEALILMVISAAFFVVLRFLQRAEPGGTGTKGTLVERLPKLKGGWKRILKVGFTIILTLEALPLLMLSLISLAKEGSWTWQLLPEQYTLENFRRLLGDPAVFEPIWNSIVMSCIAVLATVLVGITASYLLTKGVLRKFKNPLDLVLSSPFSIPGTVVAIYLILAFDSPTLFTGGTVLVGTFWLMPLAYFIRTYPFVLRSVSSSLERLDDSMLEAAESLGAGISFRFRRVVVPIILPAVISGSLLVMISSLGEFVASILLYTPTNRPISIEILSQLRGYNFGSAAAYSIFLLLIVMVLTVISGRVVRQSVGTQPSGLNF